MKELLLKHGTIYPVSRNPFVGDILIVDGKISEISERIKAKNIDEIDITGKYIFPGFIDPHSHIGLFEEGVGNYYQDGNEATDPITPHVRAIDAYYPDDAAIARALSGGVTTVMIVPGSANPIGGQSAIIKLNSQITDESIIKEPAGLKMALGENPKRVYGTLNKTPSTRLGNAAIIREYFIQVQNYIKKKNISMKEKTDFTDLNIKFEIGEKVLKREVTARIHAHRKDDILTAIRLSDEFGFELVIEHATEAYMIADYIKDKGIPLILGPFLGFRTKLETKNRNYHSISIINKKEILASLTCDHSVIPLEHASIQAATALRYGAKEEDLIKMLTINPAKILKINDRVGSIDVGKDADLVIWSGHPFDFRSYVEKTFINGEIVYKR
jgi:imidazolonepropionase-like amidohydrolase